MVALVNSHCTAPENCTVTVPPSDTLFNAKPRIGNMVTWPVLSSDTLTAAELVSFSTKITKSPALMVPLAVKVAVFPAVPAAPVAPVAPVEPVKPVAPAEPVPVAPVAPVAPVEPVAPVDPVAPVAPVGPALPETGKTSGPMDRKSTRLNSSHLG